ncbi:MAG: GMC family oxidoreductase [Gammaproteobacteria bacterium]|nr:GMC family oxidoreductase [Gammaproteobacteria bacterium]
MFIDCKNLPDNSTIDTDVCVIGAGAAGITIAREFIGSPERVAVIESGGFKPDARTQALYKGDNVGLPTFDLEVNRLRYFGGTTNHWAGHCRPLDRIDFEVRDWMPHSGWPISRADLESYYRRAQPICGLGPYEYENLDFWTTKTGLPDLELDDARLKSAVYNQSPPTRFGKVYREELGKATNVKVYLNANLQELRTDSSASKVTQARVTCIDGPKVSVSARLFILATGGMENARILLLSDKDRSGGLGNEQGLVGRYFMDHILLRPGEDISLSDPKLNLDLYHSLHSVDGGKMFSVLASTERLMRKERMPNFRIHLIRASAQNKTPVGKIFTLLDELADPAGDRPRLESKTKRDSIALHLVLEPVPNPDSRISLTDKRDLFGQKKIAVNWQVTDADLAAVYRALELAALEFGRMGYGRGCGVIFEDQEHWPSNLEAGRHHCGTTRMSTSPKTGVVNRDCQVFDVPNLYIAGSSVFPTIGYANPTLTIVALALRLADHAKEQLR